MHLGAIRPNWETDDLVLQDLPVYGALCSPDPELVADPGDQSDAADGTGDRTRPRYDMIATHVHVSGPTRPLS